MGVRLEREITTRMLLLHTAGFAYDLGTRGVEVVTAVEDRIEGRGEILHAVNGT